MIRICKQNQENIMRKIYTNSFDNVATSVSSLTDEIILSMNQHGILDCLTKAIEDKRAHNTVIPFRLVLALAASAKMKTNTSISDIPYAISNHRVLAELGYNIVDTKGNLKKELMKESSLRFLIGKYNDEELYRAYNNTVQNFIMPKMKIETNIHILDCTDLEVNLNNENYEGAEVTKNKDGKTARGYKLGCIRGIVEDTGIIEDICFGSMKTHDLELVREMVKNSPVFKPGDILINDKGFIDRNLINYLKKERGVDTYVPLRANMVAYQVAISVAQAENNWEQHPNHSRANQKIAFVQDLGVYWESKNPKEDVEINAAVCWDTESNNYFVFVTTDTSQTANQIILTYELRPEIEEDYRQLKDFWKLEDFKSTKSVMVAFHIITILFGYLFFQLFTLLPEGEKYSHKSLPVVLKNYQSQASPWLIFYAGYEFGIFSITDFAKIYTNCSNEIQKKLEYIFGSYEGTSIRSKK